ncbi:MAG: PBP1A family penicillin-binding protein [Chitinivibrionales bacterium]|nr:PBP1A family penicillin-binding protein [Chitinivibrionales bacterium]
MAQQSRGTPPPSGNSDRQSPPPRPRPTWRARALGVLIIAVIQITAFAAAAAVGGLAWFLKEMYATLPTFEQLHDIEPPQISQVFAHDGSLVHEFSIERRIWAPMKQIPDDLANAVISIEDRRFYTHWGIDLRRIAGAIVVDVIRGHYAQGASTITQQLARNLYLTSRQTLVRKIREALTALQLESYYTKREILESYLNQVYLGAGVYGVQAASRKYFSKDVSELTLNECAVLAGTIQLPERYRPDKEENIKRITARRNTVLRAMGVMEFIDKKTVEKISAEPIPSNPLEAPPRRAPYFVEMVRQEISRKYGDDALYNGGLTIYTTLDPVAQDTIERAAARHLKDLQARCNRIFLDSTDANVKLRMPRDTFLAHFDSLYETRREEYDALPDSVKLRIAQVAVVALDVKTGGVLALVGGRDFDESKFNRAIQARRQPGSAIKPIVYTAAIDSGYTPATVVLDQPITLMTDEGEWRPENYNREFHGPVTLRYALAKSINLVAIQVLMDIGPHRVIRYARRMGLEHRLPAVPALAIGAAEATPMEMTAAYASLAAAGLYTEPHFIEKVYDRNGRLLEQMAPDTHRVVPPQTAYVVTSMMQDVVLRGTGARIPGMGFTRPAGGKTGTTNDYSDAWFVGYTPQIACGVWVGVDERRSLGRGVTGSDGAIPIWVPAMKALHRDRPLARFEPPEDIVLIRVCNESHKVANRYCPSFREEPFIVGTFTDTCDVHVLGRTRRDESLHQLFGGSTRRPAEKDTTHRRRPLMF